METADFAVVGAGIAGASSAYELAAHGRVVLLEQEAVPGYHTTGRSAALYTEVYERGPVRSLVVASRPFLTAPPDGFTDHPLLTPRPVLLIADPGREGTLADLAADARVQGVQGLRELGPSDLIDMCPVLRPGRAAAGLLEEGSAEIDVHALHQGYLRGLRVRGGEVAVRAGVVSLEQGGSGWLIDAGPRRLAARVVVNAAGAWADRVAELAGARPAGVQPYRRTAFTFAAPDVAGRLTLPFVADLDERFYFKPEGDGFMASLAEETPVHPHDARPAEVDVALAIERIEAATVLRIRSVRRAWAGLRSFAADRLPVVGEDPDRPGFFWLAGQGGYGIMSSPALARLLAGLVVSGRPPVDLAGAGLDPGLLEPARHGAE